MREIISMGDSTFDQMGELAKLVERAAKFGREVTRENKELKKAIRNMESHRGKPAPESPETRSDESTEVAPQDGAEDLNTLRDENKDLADHCVRLETENENLLNFYVASHELHSTLKSREVLGTIQEIVINLIGADRFAVYLAIPGSDKLSVAMTEGMDPAELDDISLTNDPVGQSLAGRSIFVVEKFDENQTEPIAGVPLSTDDQTLGAILIYGLLEQKEGFGDLDHGLFALLAQHAGTALMSAQLYAASERKRETFEAATRLLMDNE